MHDESTLRAAEATCAVDPVCGCAVDATRTCFDLVRDGETYYFCSLECQVAFMTSAQPSENAHA